MKLKRQVQILLLVAAASTNASAADLVTGETITDSQLQRDVVGSPGFPVLISRQTNSVMLAPRGICPKADKIVAKMLEPPANRTANSKGRLVNVRWQELWTATACGRDVPVYVLFQADSRGETDYSLGAKPFAPAQH